MKNLLILTFLLLSACSFKSKDDAPVEEITKPENERPTTQQTRTNTNTSTQTPTTPVPVPDPVPTGDPTPGPSTDPIPEPIPEPTPTEPPIDLSKIDTDGDRVNDLEEKNLGLNPFVADLPELQVRFIQNYLIRITYHPKTKPAEKKDFVIDTKVGRNDPDFKYRVGELLIRAQAYKEGARIGRFSTHSFGEITQEYLSRVQYPEVDPKFTNEMALSLNKILVDKNIVISNIRVELENTAKLLSSSLFTSIKNLALNFYWFDYRKEKYELLNTTLVERSLNRDTLETIKIVIPSVPAQFILDNYLKRGEFVISEVKDFEIPDSSVKYSELIKSVKDKTVQMVLNTPFETITVYVAPDKLKNKFSDILTHSYPNQFTIEENRLTKFLQFQNNLPDYSHLREVRAEDKKGKWLVLTSKLSRAYLDHEFTPNDVIVLSYMTGKDLAEQVDEKIYSARTDISGDNEFKIYPMGNISPNSVVNFQLSPGMLLGEYVERMEDRPSSPGGSCGRNCYNLQFDCHIQFHIFKKRNVPFKFKKDFTLDLEQISLMVNQEEFSLKKLAEEKKIEVVWRGDNVHFQIRDILKIKEIADAEDHVIGLKIKTVSAREFEGVNLLAYSGQHYPACFQMVGGAAYENKWPVYTGSKDFAKWKGNLNWTVLKMTGDRSYVQPFTVSLSSIVKNYLN